MSMPRPITTIAIARPRMPSTATFCSSVNIFEVVKKLGRISAKMTNSTAKTTNTIPCCPRFLIPIPVSLIYSLGQMFAPFDRDCKPSSRSARAVDGVIGDRLKPHKQTGRATSCDRGLAASLCAVMLAWALGQRPLCANGRHSANREPAGEDRKRHLLDKRRTPIQTPDGIRGRSKHSRDGKGIEANTRYRQGGLILDVNVAFERRGSLSRLLELGGSSITCLRLVSDRTTITKINLPASFISPPLIAFPDVLSADTKTASASS